MCAAIRLSSAKSVELELQSVVLFSEIEAVGIPFDANKAEILNSKVLRVSEFLILRIFQTCICLQRKAETLHNFEE